MKEIRGNIFDIKDADAICVTTNGVVKGNGELVMGAGIALEFKKRWPHLPMIFGKLVKDLGNVVNEYTVRHNGDSVKVFTFPTKYDWKDKSDLALIQQSARELVKRVNWYQFRQRMQKIVLTRPGCGNGGLDWEKEVKPAIQDILDDRFYIITP